MDDKCPYCGAETRPGDNFCLNCGNRLLVATPSYQQATPLTGDATIPGSDQWSSPIGTPLAPAFNDRPIAESTVRDEGATQQATVDNPARFTVRDDKGDVLQEYRLEKMETVIGRAPSSDILLAKDKLTSRRHAVVRYDNGDYVISDERSANGTFVNGKQLEELVPRSLKDGDHVGIGEHELIFHLSSGVEDIPTISVPQEVIAETIVREAPYQSTQEEKPMTAASSDDFSQRSMDGDGAVSVGAPAPQPVGVLPTAESAAPTPAEAPAPQPSVPSTPAVPSFTPSEASGPANGSITFNRLTSLPTPTVPDITQLMAALTTLDGQVSLLQEQLNNSQEAIRGHEVDIAQTANQLRSGVRRVSERMDSTIADVARQREQAGWADLLQLMEDVMNNPRDIEYVTKLARKARELNKVFQIHQIVLNTLAECNSLLRSLIGDEKS